MVEEISAERNSLWLRCKATATEWIAVIIATTALLVTIVFSGVSLFNVGYTAGRVEQAIEHQNQEIQDLTTQVNIYKLRANRIDAWLKAHGVPIEEIHDD